MEKMRSLAEIDAEIAQVKESLSNVKGTPTEVYARIVGYYRAVSNWNKGKRDEYSHRKMFKYGESHKDIDVKYNDFSPREDIFIEKIACTKANDSIVRYDLFVRKTCPNCPPVKEYVANLAIEGNMIDVDSETGFEKAGELGVMKSPTAIFYDSLGVEVARASSVEELQKIFESAGVLC